MPLKAFELYTFHPSHMGVSRHFLGVLHFLGLYISCQVTNVREWEHDVAAAKLREARY